MKLAATTLLILLLTATFVAQPQTNWMKYDSPEGRYSILFPCKPDLTSQEAPAKTGQKLTQFFATCDDPDLSSAITYSAAYFDLAPGMNYSFDEARDGYLKAVNATLQSEKQIQFGAYPGREVKATAKVSGADLFLMVKFYLVEKRVYLLQFISDKSTESPHAAERFGKFYDSFALANSK
jgi:hypothetical protein